MKALAAMLAAVMTAAAPARAVLPANAPATAGHSDELQRKAIEAAKKVPQDPQKLDEYISSVTGPLDELSKSAPPMRDKVAQLKSHFAGLKKRLAQEKPDPKDQAYDECLKVKPGSQERLACLFKGFPERIAGLGVAARGGPGGAGADAAARLQEGRPVGAGPRDAVPTLDANAPRSELYARGVEMLKQQYAQKAAAFTDDKASSMLAFLERAQGQRKFYQGDLAAAEMPSAVKAFQTAHHLDATGSLDQMTRLALEADYRKANSRSQEAPQRGEESARVGALQRLLRTVNRRLTVDNKFGDATYAALRRYLSGHGDACSGSDCGVEAAPQLLAKLSQVPAAQMPVSMRHPVVGDVPAPVVDDERPSAVRAAKRKAAEVKSGLQAGAAEAAKSVLPQALPPSRVPLSPMGEAVRQLGQVFQLPQRAIQSLAESLSQRPNAPRYVGVADLRGPAGAKRLAVIDLNAAQANPNRAVQFYNVKEGSGGRKGYPLRTSAQAAKYENKDGSFLTPSGLFALPTNIESKYGGALRLHGLDGDNRNSADRGILMHRAFSHAWSEGCLEVQGDVRAVLAKLRGGLVYIAH